MAERAAKAREKEKGARRRRARSRRTDLLVRPTRHLGGNPTNLGPAEVAEQKSLSRSRRPGGASRRWLCTRLGQTADLRNLGKILTRGGGASCRRDTRPGQTADLRNLGKILTRGGGASRRLARTRLGQTADLNQCDSQTLRNQPTQRIFFCVRNGEKTIPRRELETGSRPLKMGPARRFLRHSHPFASISIRLQKRFGILTGEDRRIGARKNVDVRGPGRAVTRGRPEMR